MSTCFNSKHHVGLFYSTEESVEFNRELVIIRGLPGSGKSTMGKVLRLAGYEHYEADQYFMKDGIYQYDASKVRHAHLWCQSAVRTALAQNKRVVVCNTFTRIKELTPYLALSKKVRIIEAKGNWQNIHGVPAIRLHEMAARWEELPTDWHVSQ